jgi:transketolase
VGKRGRDLRAQWEKCFREYGSQFPKEAAELEMIQNRQLPPGWDKNLPVFPADPKGVATRESGGKALNVLAQNIPWLVGGSADLGNSNKTTLKFPGAGDFSAESYKGRNLHFGVREHAMGAALNGMSVSRLLPFGGTFFNFSDYTRPTIRLGALMETPVIYVFTHDSIGLGEDGPTHQPIEQLASLRAVSNITVLRPGDANEAVEAWKIAVQAKHGPVLLVLSRQAMPTLDRTKYAPASGVAKGAYILADGPSGKPDVILIGTGSELSLCVEASEKLKAEGIHARIVSMPSWELFEQQEQSYKDRVLPPQITARVSVEMGSTLGWERYVGAKGQMVGMHSFGASAPLKDLLKKFGFVPDIVVAAAKKAIAASQ